MLEPRRAALIVVHGIGNQSPGKTAERVARALSTARPLGTETLARAPGPTSPPSGVQTAHIEDREVSVFEAHWANRSHPDNPPWVHNALGALPELARSTLGGLRQAVRPLASADATPGLPEALFCLLLVGLAVFTYGNELFGMSEETAATTVTVLFYALFGHSIWFVWRRRKALGRPAGPAGLASWLGDIIAVIARPIVAMTAVFSVAIIVPLLIIAAPINLLGMAMAWPFRATGWALSRLRLTALARWIHRLGWILVVLPVNSFLQALKACVTLLSVALTETSVVRRLRALLWFPAIGAAFLMLIFLCEMIVIPPIAAVASMVLGQLEDEPGMGMSTLVIGLLFFGVYLLMVRLAVPVLDPLLDVSNYHLATPRDREAYFEPLDRVVATLVDAGYTDLHVLAHSLGTVLVFDWLKQRPPDAPTLTSLHTIGSPLNKFWFVDYPLARRRDTRGLAGAVRRTWTNYWAFSDPVSGALSQFDAPELSVANRRLRWLGPFLISHNAYWQRDEVIRSLRRDVAGPE